jgi:rhodanese-related sulfurtransferase
MKLSIGNWTLNRKLALLIGGLGFLAIFAGSPYKGFTSKVDSQELAAIVQKEVDHVSPEELAGWIISGKADYRLVDLRKEAVFAEYHIPTAENILLPSISEGGLSRGEKVILYSDGGIHSAQAWFLLKANGYKGVYILRGGLEEWKDKVLFPRLAENAPPAEVAAFEKVKLVSTFFGGSPQVGGAAALTAPTMALPKLDAPAGGPVKAGTGKKKKEGC